MTGSLKIGERLQTDQRHTIISNVSNDGQETIWNILVQDVKVDPLESSLDDSVSQACFGTAHIFAKALQLGRIRGIVGIFSLEQFNVEENRYTTLIVELLKRDILIVTYGLAALSLQKLNVTSDDSVDFAGEGLTEFCNNLDIQPIMVLGKSDNIKSLPVFGSLIAEKAGISNKEIPMTLMVIENENICLYDQTGNNMMVHPADSIEAIAAIDSHIHDQRLSIDWCDRYHCSIFS